MTVKKLLTSIQHFEKGEINFSQFILSRNMLPNYAFNAKNQWNAKIYLKRTYVHNDLLSQIGTTLIKIQNYNIRREIFDFVL